MHEAMIAQQKEQLKNDIDKRLDAYNASVQKFAARWQQLKPAGVPEGKAEAEEAAQKMKGWQSEFKGTFPYNRPCARQQCRQISVMHGF